MARSGGEVSSGAWIDHLHPLYRSFRSICLTVHSWTLLRASPSLQKRGRAHRQGVSPSQECEDSLQVIKSPSLSASLCGTVKLQAQQPIHQLVIAIPASAAVIGQHCFSASLGSTSSRFIVVPITLNSAFQRHSV